MSYFDELVSKIDGFVGKTIEKVNVVQSFDGGEVARLEFVFESGETLEITPSSYNYGPQDLCFHFS